MKCLFLSSSKYLGAKFCRYESLMKQARERQGDDIKQTEAKAGGVLV